MTTLKVGYPRNQNILEPPLSTTFVILIAIDRRNGQYTSRFINKV
jgi:hypothetical protein